MAMGKTMCRRLGCQHRGEARECHDSDEGYAEVQHAYK